MRRLSRWEMFCRVWLLIGDEMAAPRRWWWLSFADGSLPKGTQFLGVAIVRGESIMSAAFEARMHDANPGGEVLGLEIPPDRAAIIPPEYLNTLLNRSQLEALDALMGGNGCRQVSADDFAAQPSRGEGEP